jgi:hypothetical protein
MQLRTLLARYKQTGNLAAALTAQAEMENPDPSKPVPADNPLPPDLAGIRSTYVVNVQRLTQSVRGWYRQQLDALEKLLVTRGDLAGAQAVKSARLDGEAMRDQDGSAIEIPSAVGRFNWRAAKQNVTYSYRDKSFCRGIFDYSDSSCVKLLDGKTADQHSPHMVAWLNTKPSPIRFEFAEAVMPSAVRIHILGGTPKLGYQVPKGIEVRDGSSKGIGPELGRLSELEDKTGWFEVPMKLARPVRVLWIVMERSRSELVGIDEVEFK